MEVVIFQEVLDLMKNINQESLMMSMDDCHVKGVFSLVVGGVNHGELTRVFIANKTIKPFDIQFHSHRYDLTIGVIHGQFTHHIAKEAQGSDFVRGDAVKMKKFEYKSPLNGGNGLIENGRGYFDLHNSNVPAATEMYLPCDLIHTVSAKKGTIWIVKEHGFAADSSVVLGRVFDTSDLYNKPKQFQINNMYDLVLSKLKAF